MSKRVLIVEDEQDVADLVADVLDLEGYESWVVSGESAFDAALTFRPDVVLLDLMMPYIDGFEVGRRLSTDERTRTIPIVVMTAMHSFKSQAPGISSSRILAKPFDIRDLLRTVQQATQA